MNMLKRLQESICDLHERSRAATTTNGLILTIRTRLRLKLFGYKLPFYLLSAQVLLLGNCLADHCAPQAIGEIEDQTIFVNSHDCGPNSLEFDITPYFDGYGQPLTYCLSHIFIDGDVSNMNVALDPFNGILNVPLGWFGVNTTVNLKFIAKNPYGSAIQQMRIFLEPCGG